MSSRSSLGKDPSMYSRRPRARVGQQEQKSTRDAPCACALECESSLGAICGHMHSCVQTQAFGGWEPQETWGCSSAGGPQGAGAGSPVSEVSSNGKRPTPAESRLVHRK